MALEKELQTYHAHRLRWVQEGRVGKWVVIHGEDVLGFFDNANAALEAGYRRYGLDATFMVREVTEADRIIQTPRRAVHVTNKH